MVGWLISNLFSYRTFSFSPLLAGSILQCGGGMCVLTSYDDLRAPSPGSTTPPSCTISHTQGTSNQITSNIGSIQVGRDRKVSEHLIAL